MLDSLTWRLRTQCKKLFIRDLALPCMIGVYDYEHDAPQPVIFNAEVWVLDENARSQKDQLGDVLDYTLLIEIIRTTAQTKHTELQETLVDNIATALLTFPEIVLLHLSSEKPEAYQEAKGVGVEIWRKGQAFPKLAE